MALHIHIGSRPRKTRDNASVRKVRDSLEVMRAADRARKARDCSCGGTGDRRAKDSGLSDLQNERVVSDHQRG